MKYLSFSLWGDQTIYNIGAIKSAELWKTIYPEWKMVVYYDESVPSEIIDKLDELGVLLVDMTGKKVYGMFWRFFAFDFNDAEYCIFRDTDSRLTLREKLAVDEWIKSGKSLHVMRDHPAHRIPYGNNGLGILGGMWGIKKGMVPITQMINDFIKGKNLSYGSDQTFLASVYSIFQNDRCTHDEFFEKKPFPIPREPGRFVGERMDENDKPVGNDYKYVI